MRLFGDSRNLDPLNRIAGGECRCAGLRPDEGSDSLSFMAANAMEHLNLALEASNEGIWHWDFGSATMDFSEKVGEFFGCERNQVPNFFEEEEFVHEEDRATFFAEIAALRVGERRVLAVESRLRTAGEGGDEWKWFRVRAVPVKENDGLHGMAGSLIDISQRKKAELDLVNTRHLTETLVENVPLQIYVKDRESRFTMVNSAMVKWSGYQKPSDLIGKTDADIFCGEEHWKKALADEQKILATGEPMEPSLEKETWSGQEDTWVLTTKLPYRDQKGRLQGTFGVSSDVTELVRSQRSLAELAAELKQRNTVYEEEMALAREIQQGLLPTEYPAAGGAQFGHRYLPISGLAGDFFDVIDLGENQVGLLICDVMGHGVRSALVASLLRGLVSQAMGKASSPSLFLESLNTGLVSFLQKAKVTMFATAFYIVVDFEKGKISYASAGHPAGIMSDGERASLLPLGGRGKGPGLGLIPEAVYGEESIPLEGVKKLLLFTDGIFEVENSDGDAFLQNRLVRTVAEMKGRDLEEMLDYILSKVKGFTEGGGFDDDVCLLGMSL